MITKPRFSGILTALVTPLDETGGIDEGAVARLIEHLCSGGVSGVCPVGSTGEGPHLSAAARLQVMRVVRRETGPRLPIIPGIALNTLDDAERQAGEYAAAGADGLLVAPPFYYHLLQPAVRDFFVVLADRSPIPIVLYNIPQFTKISIAPEMVAELARHPNIVGIKDSSRDFEYFERIAAASPPRFSVLTGSDTMLLASLMVGGHGAIAASSNLVPAWSVGLLEAFAAGQWQSARSLQFRILNLVQICRVGSFPAGWKAALELAGLCTRRTVPPTEPLPQELLRRLHADLVNLGLDLGSGKADLLPAPSVGQGL